MYLCVTKINKMKVQDFTAKLFEIEVVAHIAHLQTTSFAKHNALDNLYKDIVDHRDSFCESYQGKYGIITNYSKIEIKEGLDMITYIKDCISGFEKYRLTLTDGYLQQIIDDIIELLASVNYKLINLK